MHINIVPVFFLFSSLSFLSYKKQKAKFYNQNAPTRLTMSMNFRELGTDFGRWVSGRTVGVFCL